MADLLLREHMERALATTSLDYYTPVVMGRVYADFVLENAELKRAEVEIQKFYTERGFSYDGETCFEKGDKIHTVTVSKLGYGVIIHAAEN